MTNRREQIKSLRLQHPEFTLSRIGSQVGKTRERVRQVLVEEGLPTRAVRSKRPKRYCLNCGNQLHHGNGKFCSHSCYSSYYRITLRCDFCGMQFTRAKGRVPIGRKRNKHTFCSKTCQGAWLAKWYGLSTQILKRLDYERIRRLYDEGYNGMQIASITGEKFTSIYGAIYRMGLRFRQPMRAEESGQAGDR